MASKQKKVRPPFWFRNWREVKKFLQHKRLANETFLLELYEQTGKHNLATLVARAEYPKH